MKYAKELPVTDRGLSRDLEKDGWKKIKEPKNLAIATLCSLPFAFMLGGIVILFADFLNPSIFNFARQDSFSFTINFNVKTLVCVVAIIPSMILHEFIHVMFTPNFMKSDKTFWGLNGVFGFVFTTEMIKRGRFIIISVMPWFFLSVSLPFVLNIFGLLNGYTVFLCLINAMGSCVDFLNVFLVAFQVPNGNTITNNGFETYHIYVK